MYCKLTDQECYTRPGEANALLWGEGVTHRPSGGDRWLCGDGVIHYYASPEIAAFMNPIRANFPHPRCWEVAVESHDLNDGVKCGTFGALTTVREIPLPEITIEQRVEIAKGAAAKTSSWTSRWAAAEATEAAKTARWAAGAAKTARWAAGAAKASSWASRWAAAEAAKAAEAAAWAAEAAAREKAAPNKKSFTAGLHFLICAVIYGGEK